MDTDWITGTGRTSSNYFGIFVTSPPFSPSEATFELRNEVKVLAKDGRLWKEAGQEDNAFANSVSSCPFTFRFVCIVHFFIMRLL